MHTCILICILGLIYKRDYNALICSSENCPALLNPTNGRVMLTDRSEGSRAVYECDSGYALSGDGSRVCGDDGRWTEEQPQCCE